MKLPIPAKQSFALILSALLAGGGLAQPTAATLGPLGLPRLKAQGAGGSESMARSGFSEDALSTQGFVGMRGGEKRGAKFLALEGKKEWSRPLRGNSRDTLYISFAVYGSPGTVVDVGGARFSVAASTVPSYAQLRILDAAGQWQPTGFNVPFDFCEGKVLAFLPVLTVRLVPTTGTFDLYQNARLLAEDLPLQADKGGRKFTLMAGSDGAWIMGLVQSDENPLYPDANNNGVDDRFEQAKRGKLLAGNASKADRQDLIAHWRHDQRTNPAPALFVNLPPPDGD